MRLKSVVVKVSLILCVLGGLAIASALWHGNSPEGKGSSGMGIFLARPAFAQEDGTSFLEQEAGIAAYTDVGRSIDLAKANGAFRTVERETGEYIIGSVALPDYSETEDVHAYVHRDGWVVTYYLKDEPAAKIVDWNNYDEDENMEGTKLELGILIACSIAEIPTTDVQYYDFRYPNANRLMIVAEALWHKGDDDGFKISLPSELVFYERSYSHCAQGSEGIFAWSYSEMRLDDRVISTKSDRATTHELISPTQLSPDVPHIIDMNNRSFSAAFGAIVLVYQQS